MQLILLKGQEHKHRKNASEVSLTVRAEKKGIRGSDFAKSGCSVEESRE